MLKITNLSKQFHKHDILKNINIEIKSNEIIGLAGASGSGKSTLLRCIQKLETQDNGTIETNDTSGFMFQDFQLFPHMTVLQNVTYSPKILKNNENYQTEAIKILEKLNLSHRLNNYPSQLSGGQKQRVALARTLMIKPKILLCDEPTSGLDVATIDEVISLLKNISKEMGMTTIIASHDLDFLSKIANRILVLKEGVIVNDIDVEKTPNVIDLLKTFY
jgi:polar amino acid transport system ATP-binding protein